MHDASFFDPREDAVREIGLTFPEVTEDFPWGHRTLKVRKKSFAFMGSSEEGFFISMKLPHSKDEALALPGASPTGYGLARTGWVSLSFPPDVDPDMDRMRAWLIESYRAVAPKKLAAMVR